METHATPPSPPSISLFGQLMSYFVTKSTSMYKTKSFSLLACIKLKAWNCRLRSWISIRIGWVTDRLLPLFSQRVTTSWQSVSRQSWVTPCLSARIIPSLHAYASVVNASMQWLYAAACASRICLQHRAEPLLLHLARSQHRTQHPHCILSIPDVVASTPPAPILANFALEDALVAKDQKQYPGPRAPPA